VLCGGVQFVVGWVVRSRVLQASEAGASTRGGSCVDASFRYVEGAEEQEDGEMKSNCAEKNGQGAN
jgi:hypothetical protein